MLALKVSSIIIFIGLNFNIISAINISETKLIIRTIEDALSKSNSTYKIPNLTEIIESIPSKIIETVRNAFNKAITNEDVYLNITQLINKYGFKSETYEVKTEDGYILTMHRIPGKGKPVFLMHCLTGSSDDWITAGPESGIAYLLAREGYDVWMGNNRGNKHSRKNTNLSPEDKDFWNFSWDEIALYDLPVMIDHVLEVTGEKKLQYVGHSQGSTVGYVLCSMKPEYNDKISLMISLSAVAFMSHVESPIVRLGLPLMDPWEIVNSFGFLYEFLPASKLTRGLEHFFCGTVHLADTICIDLVFLLVGFDYDQVNATNLPVFFGHIPSGSATKQFIHYGQEVLSGEFRRYDHGWLGNFEKYGHPEPPRYPLEKITAPMAIFYSKGDWLASVKDVEILVNKLNNVVFYHEVPVDNFNHIDYVWAKDVKELIYKPISKLLKQYG